MTPDELRAARAMLALTQAELAWDLDVSLRTIRHWESGRTRIPVAVAYMVRERLAKSVPTSVQS